MDLALDLTQMVQEFRKNLKPTQFFIPTSFCFYNFAQKSILWVVLALVLLLTVFGAGPGPGLDPDGPRGLEKPKTIPVFHFQQLLLTQLCPEINPLGCPCSRPTPGSLWCLDLTQMVLAVRKKLKTTHLNIPNSFCFNNFAQKSIPGDVRAQVLQVPVGASHADQVRKSGMHHPFLDPGGQEESPGTPHWSLASKVTFPRWYLL